MKHAGLNIKFAYTIAGAMKSSRLLHLIDVYIVLWSRLYMCLIFILGS